MKFLIDILLVIAILGLIVLGMYDAYNNNNEKNQMFWVAMFKLIFVFGFAFVFAFHLAEVICG